MILSAKLSDEGMLIIWLIVCIALIIAWYIEWLTNNLK